MIEQVIEKISKEQLPYFKLQGKPIKGINSQYWLIFNNEASNKPVITKIIKLLGQSQNDIKTRVIRIDATTGKIYNYSLAKEGDVPYATIFKTQELDIIEKFLKLDCSHVEDDLVRGSFLEVKDNSKRRYSLPKDINTYSSFISDVLSRAKLYRRSTGYFESGVLKLYQEPLQEVIKSGGKINVLVDWQGFIDKRDLDELEKLQDLEYRNNFIAKTIEEFLKKLDEDNLTSAEIMAELIRLDILEMRMIKMDDSRAIYHKKLGILTDQIGNHILHEGSDNFTRAAHSRNNESITFLYSFDSKDLEIINQSIDEFDQEWENKELTHKISREFLVLVEKERERRNIEFSPSVESITPTELKPGKNENVEFKGKNLDKIDSIDVSGNDLIKVDIKNKTPDKIDADINVDSEHPPISIDFELIQEDKKHPVSPKKPVKIKSKTKVDDYSEIEGFKEALEKILSGNHAGPKDFLYWLSKQRPQQFKIEKSEYLEDLVTDGTLFDHQKSGAQHCYRVVNDFGVSVCADAVGLGKTRLAAAVAKLMGKEKIAIIAARKFHSNWVKEMECLGFTEDDYELYNKNLMGRKNSNFLEDFNRYGGPDFIIIDEAHEGIRNYKNKVHKTCLAIKNKDQISKNKKQRHYLLLTATPWNNRREDIYNIISPFLTKPQGFRNIGYPEVASYFENRESIELFTDNTKLFRQIYKEVFLQRTRAMLKAAYPALNLYAKRVAKWLPVKFENKTERALDEIFHKFEEELAIPFANPIRYFSEGMVTSSLPQNLKKFFLQRAESSMYALSRTISNFEYKITSLEEALKQVEPSAEGLEGFLIKHYKLDEKIQLNENDQEELDSDEDNLEEDEDDEVEENEKRLKLKQAIENAVEILKNNPQKAIEVYENLMNDCRADYNRLQQIKKLLSKEFVVDHKKKVVTDKVKDIIKSGKKVLLISTFSDTVLDYYNYMIKDSLINNKGIGMSIGGSKVYYLPDGEKLQFKPNNYYKNEKNIIGIRREDIFRLFAPEATCRKDEEKPLPEEELSILIGSETLSIGQNLQDADILINIDLPWNPMILEQRIGRIDRPKKHKVSELNIYYANSESQLLRQASRLDKLNEKLVGEGVIENGQVSRIQTIDQLGASIYGDTLFDDEVLPDYIDFLKSLSKARNVEQGNIQEKAFERQDEYKELITQIELLYGEDISQLIKDLGEDYVYNPVTLGRHTGSKDEPKAVIGISVEFLGPNGELIPDRGKIILWNDISGEKGAFSQAVQQGCSTPESSDIFSVKYLKESMDDLYKKLIKFKNELTEKEINADNNLDEIRQSSNRLNLIVLRIQKIQKLDNDITKERIKTVIQKLNSWKNNKVAQKLLKEYSSKKYENLDDNEFLKQFLKDVESKNFMDASAIKINNIKIKLESILLKA